MKIRNKSEMVTGVIESLEKRGREEKVALFTAVAKGLNRPRRKAHEVNLSRLEKYAKEKETVVVPGYVLGSGEIKKALNVVALRFSRKAEEKIKKAGGKCMDMENFIEGKETKARIMG